MLRKENIGPGIENERDTGSIRRRLHGADFIQLFRKRYEFMIDHVFQVHAHRAGGDDFARGTGGIAIARFHIGGQRNIDGRGHARHHEHHFVARNALAIGIAEDGGDARASGGRGGKPLRFHDPRADGVPCVRKDENFGAGMQLPEAVRAFAF